MEKKEKRGEKKIEDALDDLTFIDEPDLDIDLLSRSSLKGGIKHCQLARCMLYYGDFMEMESTKYIARTLKSKFSIVPDFIKHRKWFWRARKVETPCMNCGSNNDVWCLRAKHQSEISRHCNLYISPNSDGPYGDFNEYYHICLDCGNITHKAEAPGQRTCRDHMGTIRPKCPFCGQDW
jgi:hypothetical protein